MLSLGNLLCGGIVHCAALDPEIGTCVTHSNSGWDGAHSKEKLDEEFNKFHSRLRSTKLAFVLTGESSP
jgi:hypothetical protein